MTSQPHLHQHAAEIQEFGTVIQLPIALSRDARQYSCQRLNRILADTQFLYALYKKCHWGMRGPTAYQLHLLFDKHAQEQLELVDALAERVQTLGGVAVGDPRHAATRTRPSSPTSATPPPGRLSSATTAPRTSWSPRSSAPVRPRSGSSPSTWSSPPRPGRVRGG